jgi:hypothetical protein
VVLSAVSQSKGKWKRQSSRRGSFYQLSEVRQKIAAGDVMVHPNAIRCAFQDFGLGIEGILNVYRKLQPRHFFKKANSRIKKPTVVIDYYKASIDGEDIYTHFYIDDTNGKLVINSFKKDQA